MNNFTQRQEKRLQEMMYNQSHKANESLKKDLKLMFMTRADCLSIHQGRHTPAQINGNNGKENGNGNGNPLRSVQAKFWAKVVGLITALTVLASVITMILTKIYL